MWQETSGGRRVEATLYWYPRWIWVGVLWSVVPAVLLYFALRRPLEISYSLCPDDDRSLRMRKRAAIGTWTLFVAVVIAAIVTRGNRFFLIAPSVLFFVALIVHFMAGVPLAVAGHEDGVFGVKGLSKNFLLAVERPKAGESDGRRSSGPRVVSETRETSPRWRGYRDSPCAIEPDQRQARPRVRAAGFDHVANGSRLPGAEAGEKSLTQRSR